MTEEQLTLCKEQIAAIPNEKTLALHMPCHVYLFETETLESWALIDKDKLLVAGIGENRIAELGIRAAILRKYQTDWIIVRRTGKDAEKEWKAFSVDVYDLCDELKYAFKYAFRSESELLGRVHEIARGATDSAVIQNLKTYSLLGLAHQDLLRAIGFDQTKLASASTMSDDGAKLLAEAYGSKLKGNELKVLRDKAYTHLKEVVDELRACGKYIFRKDKNRLVGYQSDYWKKKKIKSKSKEMVEV